MKLRLTKCSQYKKDSLLWQVSPLEKDSGLPDKFYLVISFRKEGNQYLRFLHERPALSWIAGGAFSALVRKHLNSAVLSEILVDSERKNIWLPLMCAGERWFLHIHHEGAVEISLVSPQSESLVRLGAKGIFTKKKDVETLPKGLTQNRLEEEIAALTRDQVSSPELEARDPAGEAHLSISHFQREARRRIARRLKTVRQASEKLAKGTRSEEDIALLEKQARLLQTYLYKILPNAEELHLSAEETGEDLRIPLRSDWSAVDNLSDYFERLKKMKRGKSALAEQLARVGSELHALETENVRLQATPVSEEELVRILRRFRLPIDKPQVQVGEDKTSLPYKVYKSDGIEILVGKGPRENDELTKAARSNDYWFHAIGMGGSHVLISSQKVPKTGLTAKLKRDASILALHFSRIRKDQSGEVYVTQRRCLTKKKGMPPGLWLVQQSETFYLSYTEGELKAILGTGNP